jgi:glutamyl-tRNA reductase
VAARLAEEGGVSLEELDPSLYVHVDEEAVVHLFRVTAGLDSMVMGETQIVAQVKGAYSAALEAGSTGVVLNRVVTDALSVSKRVRTQACIADKPLSVSSAAVGLARETLGDLRAAAALIIGAGETGRLTASSLRDEHIERLLVASRTFANAEEVAAAVDGVAVPYDDLARHLTEVDIVVSSTTAPHHVLSAEFVARTMQRRRGRPLLIIDLAVPRDVDPAAADVTGVRLCDIDDLMGVVAGVRAARARAVDEAEAIVAQGVDETMRWLRSLEVTPTIRALRDQVEEICRAELQRLGPRLGELSDEQKAGLEQLTRSIVRKVLHGPSTRLKEAAAAGQSIRYVDALQTLFALNGHAHTGQGEKTTEVEAHPARPRTT